MLKPGDLENENIIKPEDVRDSNHAKDLIDKGILSIGDVNLLVDTFVQDHKAMILLLGKDLYAHYKKQGLLDTSKTIEANISFEEFCKEQSLQIQKDEEREFKYLYDTLANLAKTGDSGDKLNLQEEDAVNLLHSYFEEAKMPNIKNIVHQFKPILKSIEELSQGTTWKSEIADDDFIIEKYNRLEKQNKIRTKIAGILIADLFINGTSGEKNKFKIYRKKAIKEATKSIGEISKDIIDYYEEKGIDLQFGQVKSQLKLKIKKTMTTINTKKNKTKKQEIAKALEASIDKKRLKQEAKAHVKVHMQQEYKKFLKKGSDDFFGEVEKQEIENIKNNFIEISKKITIPYDLIDSINTMTNMSQRAIIKGKEGGLYANQNLVNKVNKQKVKFENIMKKNKRGHIRGFIFEKLVEYAQIMYMQIATQTDTDGIIFKTEARDDTFAKSDAIYYNKKEGKLSSIDFGITEKKYGSSEEDESQKTKTDFANELRDQVVTTAFLLQSSPKNSIELDIIENQRYPFLRLPEEMHPILGEMFKDILSKKNLKTQDISDIIKKHDDIAKVKGTGVEDILKELKAVSVKTIIKAA